jgi:hypothetical protein
MTAAKFAIATFEGTEQTVEELGNVLLRFVCGGEKRTIMSETATEITANRLASRSARFIGNRLTRSISNRLTRCTSGNRFAGVTGDNRFTR